MTRRAGLMAGLLAGSALSLAACATHPAFPAPTPAEVQTEPASGYLSDTQIQALASRTPPPPAVGSPEERQDHEASARYRALEDSDRWRLAQTQAELRPVFGVQHFDCPLGVMLDGEAAPALVRFLARGLVDAGAASNLAKQARFRARPIADDPDRRACVRVDDDLRSSASYPSGHATVGALWGLMMADLAPDAAEDMVRIGEEIGVSRIVCALHYPADVAAGQALGRALHQSVRNTPDYAENLQSARHDLARLRAAEGSADPACAARRAANPQP